MCQKMFVVCLLFGILLVETSALTCDKDSVSCLKHEICIPQSAWCDGEFDCPDGSDEHYCNGSGTCVVESILHDMFRCDNGKCIPFEIVCNGYDNCGDGSDETCGGYLNTTNQSESVVAVLEAAQYLLSQRKTDYGWDNFTPRALIALAFAEKYFPISEKEKSLMTKRLDLQLFFLLRDGVENLATLALHINALYAMCKDPRDFHGIDLVKILRSKTDEATKSDFNLPIVFLTLCIANDTRLTDFRVLLKIYDDKRNDRVGVKALTLIAIFAYLRKPEFSRYWHEGDYKRNDFVNDYRNRDDNIDVYSKALVCQAYNIMGYETSPLKKQLLQLQTEDGSFGDLLGTYSAVPALLNMNLADLQCKTRTYKAKSAREESSSDEVFKPEKRIDYSLRIQSGENAGFHTLSVTFEGKKSFFDVMKMAELRNPMYRFKYEESDVTGKTIFYLAGIPNDAEKGTSWTLYRNGTRNSTRNKKELKGVDRIFPEDAEHFIFQLETKYSGQ